MKSMTGFGRAKLENDGRIYNVEIKSVNYKYIDISIKLPRNLIYLEEKIKKEITTSVSRGKIDVFITFENYSDKGKEIILNEDLIKKYLVEFKKISEENNLSMDVPVTEITKLPDVLNLKISDDDESIIENELIECAKNAVNNFVSMRELEGNKIKEDLKNRINDFEKVVENISKNSEGIVDEYIVKLEERVKEILKTDIVDESRISLEAVIYADKSSIEEELTRLYSHIKQFNKIIEEEKAVGKKLDFLIQEMNREINTIGSKAGNVDITNLVIEAKVKLEDIREQIQNIE